MDKRLHIVCLDIPYPVDYGGVFDLFHKIRALHAAGVIIHLHCFESGKRPRQEELEKYCSAVDYYPRCEGHKAFSHKLPYIVCSRSNGKLMEQLLKDEYPILLEGVHCSYLLNDPRFRDRKIILRLHNVEYQYYRQLFYAERNLLKKMYYLHESKVLRRYERSIAKKVMILAVSEKDSRQYREEFGADRIGTLPVFLPFEEVRSKAGTGCFCLYHGNLSVAENEQAAIWLLRKVFHPLHMPLIITGKNPSPKLIRLAGQYPHTCVIPNPSEEEIQDLISKAQINILPSFNCTGVKLKLLNALFNGRHCIVNEEAVEGTGLEATCRIGYDARSMREWVTELYGQPFGERDIELRKQLLCGKFNNKENVEKLIRWIW